MIPVPGTGCRKRPEERLQAIEILRQQYFELFHDGIEPRLQKVFTIVKRQRCKEMKMNRNDAWELLCEFTQSESLRKHALAVETAVTAYAKKFGEDEELWSVVALLHDFDYEKYPASDPPDGHPFKGSQILAEKGYPEDVRRAILSHADYTSVARESLLEKVLFACDELCGFITAVAYVRPTKSVREAEVKSVRKKMKDKAFAAKVSREDIIKGAQEVGMDLDEHIGFVIGALQEKAETLQL